MGQQISRGGEESANVACAPAMLCLCPSKEDAVASPSPLTRRGRKAGGDRRRIYAQDPIRYLEDISATLSVLSDSDGYHQRWGQALQAGPQARQKSGSSKRPRKSPRPCTEDEQALHRAFACVPRDLIRLCRDAAIHTVLAPPRMTLQALQDLLACPLVACIDLNGQTVKDRRSSARLDVDRPVEIRNGTLDLSGADVNLERYDQRPFCRRAGVVIRGPNVTLRGVRVMGCVGSEDRRSYALLAYRAPGLLLENCEVQDNGWNGIWAFGKGADVAIVNCKVSGCPGSGVGAWDGARVVARDCVVEHCGFQGLEAVQAGTECHVVGGVYRDSHLGVNAFAGARMRLENVVVVKNRQVGIRGVQTGTEVVVEGCTVADNALFAIKSDEGARVVLRDGTRVGPHQTQLVQLNGGTVHVLNDQDGAPLADLGFDGKWEAPVFSPLETVATEPLSSQPTSETLLHAVSIDVAEGGMGGAVDPPPQLPRHRAEVDGALELVARPATPLPSPLPPQSLSHGVLSVGHLMGVGVAGHGTTVVLGSALALPAEVRTSCAFGSIRTLGSTGRRSQSAREVWGAKEGGAESQGGFGKAPSSRECDRYRCN